MQNEQTKPEDKGTLIYSEVIPIDRSKGEKKLEKQEAQIESGEKRGNLGKIADSITEKIHEGVEKIHEGVESVKGLIHDATAPAAEHEMKKREEKASEKKESKAAKKMVADNYVVLEHEHALKSERGAQTLFHKEAKCVIPMMHPEHHHPSMKEFTEEMLVQQAEQSKLHPHIEKDSEKLDLGLKSEEPLGNIEEIH